MLWNPDSYMEQLIQECVPSLRFKAGDLNEWAKWRSGLRSEITRALGGFPSEPCDLMPEVLEEIECGGYIRRKIVYVVEPGLRVPLYMLLPDTEKDGEKSGEKMNGPYSDNAAVQEPVPGTGKALPGGETESGRRYPAVIALHGHGYGVKDAIGLNPDGSVRTGAPGYHKDFAIQLARQGFVVFAPELLGFGETRLAEHQKAAPEVNSCSRLAANLLMVGRTLLGLRVYQTMRALDLALAMPETDPERIGIMGISGGGAVAAFTAALDDRIRAAVISGYVSMFRGGIMAMHHCIDNFVPGLLRLAELPDIVSLIAPRPLLIEAGTQDRIFPILSALEAYGDITKVYTLHNALHLFQKDIFEGGHEISGRKAYAFLNTHLGG